MKIAAQKPTIIICSLLLALNVIGHKQAKAQTGQHIELLSYSLGIIQGQTARVTITLRRLANPKLQDQPIIARFQLIDTEGEVVAESSEIKVLPGQTRSWDQARSALPASREPGERLQVRIRILVTTLSADLDRSSIMPTAEVIDTITGRTIYEHGKRFLIFVSGPNGRSSDSQ